MKNKNILLLVLLFLVCILSISAISATANEDAISTDNNKNSVETINQHDDVSTSEENFEISSNENNNVKQANSEMNKTTTDNDAGTFQDLDEVINDDPSSDSVYLAANYTYDSSEGSGDERYIGGIFIDRDLTIYGNGFTIDGSEVARAFNVSAGVSVEFNNINFINCNSNQSGGALYGGFASSCNFTSCIANGYGGAICNGNASGCIFDANGARNSGGAISNGTAISCEFKLNTALMYGGALFDSNAYDCVFNNNDAPTGQAMYNGYAVLCTFNGESTNGTTVVPVNISAINYTSTYRSGEKFYFYIIADGNYYSGINATIEIFNPDGSWVKDVTALSGVSNDEGGWVVDLEPGEYYVALCLPNYPEETATADAFINVSKVAPTLFIDPINDTEVGNEIIINYTTNSTGNVTIRVNGTTLTEDRKFTPNQAGIYNVTIEVAEDQYYLAATNETTFTVSDAGKVDPFLVISPIATVPVGQVVSILFTTDSNGTVTVKVNGTVVNGTAGENGTVYNFTPDSEGIYNVTVEIAGNDYYNAVSNETTFTVGKINPTLVITPIADVVVGQVVNITYSSTSNGTVTIKVNGTNLTDTTFTPDSEGIYNVTVEIAGNDYYNAVSNETTVNVVKTKATVSINPITNVIVGHEVPISFFTNSNGTVTILVNGEPISGGKFIPPTSGSYYVTIEVAENDYYTAATNHTKFRANKEETSIVVRPITTTYDAVKDLTISLKDAEGRPLKAKVLTVTILGQSHNYVTDSNGQVKIKVPTSAPKPYTVRIKYGGSDQFKVSSASVKVTVKKATPKITAKNARFKAKTLTKNYTITLKNQNKVIKNKKVTLSVNGKTYITKTNSKGQATFKITNLSKKGTYNAVITASGNYYYNEVSKRVKISVRK